MPQSISENNGIGILTHEDLRVYIGCLDRRGEPSVVILSVQDYLDTVQSAPEWLRKAWTKSWKERRG